MLFRSPGSTVWDCSQPVPPLDSCGLIAARTPAAPLFSFRLSPNPTAAVVRVEADLLQHTAGRIRVFDVWGKMLAEKQFETAALNEIIDCQTFAPGIYFIEVQAGGRYATQKLVRE